MVHDAASYDNFFSIMEACERRYPVAEWSIDGVPVWPMMRIEGRIELILAPKGQDRGRTDTKPDPVRGAKRALRYALAPLLTPLQNRRDWTHEILRLNPVDALFLGDGFSQDFVQGDWRDRYCAPIIEALEAEGKRSLLMQPLTQRLPRERDTYSTDWIDSWGKLWARTHRARSVHLPEFSEARDFLKSRNFDFTLLDQGILERFAVRIAAMARLFEGILRKTRPKIAFAVSYYSPMGYALNLACRRQHILSVDIQHGGQDGGHEAYNHWLSLPAKGYTVMPALFWNWSEKDARAIDKWASGTAGWHGSLHGGHPQLAPWFDGDAPQTRQFDAAITAIKRRHPGTFDILVALQNAPGYGATWDALADVVASSPPSWRWWLRRHPVGEVDPGLGKLLSLRRDNVLIAEAFELPLPALLRNVGAVLTLMSSTVFEASSFCHRPIFLTQEARLIWPSLVSSGAVRVISDKDELMAHLRQLENSPPETPLNSAAPLLGESVRTIFDMARTYRAMASG